MCRASRCAAPELAWTLESISREFSHHRILHLEIEGHSGQRFRAGHNRLGEFTYQDGPTLMREFDAFLDRYQSAAYEAQHQIQAQPSEFSSLRDRLEGTHLVLREEPKTCLWGRCPRCSGHPGCLGCSRCSPHSDGAHGA